MDYASLRSVPDEDDGSRSFQMSESRSSHPQKHASLSAPNTPHMGGHESDTEPLWQPQSQTARPTSKWLSCVKLVGTQMLALLWLGPIFTLLYLNFSQHILGASAWCPFNDCYTDIWDLNGTWTSTSAHQVKLDRDTHNFLGTLQIISKALEIWFILITTWLVYLITMHLAGQPEGIPMGYLTRPSEFAEIPGLFDLLLWKTVRRLPSSQHRSRRRLWLFLVATISLCILCNLMGPAVAVLLIPTLQWRNTDGSDLEKFSKMKSDSSLTAAGASFSQSFNGSCWPYQVAAQNYECNKYGAAAIDSWVEASMSPSGTTYWMTTQSIAGFTFNQTWEMCENSPTPLLVQWVPSRQMMEKLSNDFLDIVAISNGFQSQDAESAKKIANLKPFNSTVQSFVQRKGPILGAMIGTWVDFDNQEHWTTVVDDSRSIICYRSYNDSTIPLWWGYGTGLNYTRCISTGDGWNDGSREANFTVYGSYYDNLGFFGPNLSVNVYTSHRVAWLVDDQAPPGVSRECLVNGTAPSYCDWDAFFGSNPASKKFLSGPATTIHISREIGALPGNPVLQSFAIDFTVFQRFATYSIDTSWLTNMYTTASFQVGSRCSYNPIPIDPTWVAAAWAANVSGFMPSARSLTYRLENAMDGYEDGSTILDFMWDNSLYIDGVSLMSVMQTLSIIDYETSSVPDDYGLTKDDKDPGSNTTLPILYRWGKIYVWTYGFWTRSSIFGVIITIVGCVIVLLEVFIGTFVDRREFTSPTQLVVAALEHQYHDEFRGAIGHENVVWRTRFRVREDRTKIGGLGFEKTA